jgi:hypothetical protein
VLQALSKADDSGSGFLTGTVPMALSAVVCRRAK